MKQSNRKIVEEIEIFIRYSVMESERQTAEAVLTRYSENSDALRVMRDFYARLPEFRQEAVRKISSIIVRRDASLVGVDTKNFEYLYFCSDTELLYLGEKKDGINDSEVLRFFGQTSNQEFYVKSEDNESNSVLAAETKVFCPSCGVAEGAYHLLGCPVEICPWCDGQLTYCNCRFEKLGVEEIDDERLLDRLEILLHEAGRIPFSSDQAPAYPSGGDEDIDQ
ncbi:MAG: hypothetical protein V2I36_04760 [Desulfopila sp.]|nr:hypothetical protein [Desulfopila sp.]